MVRENVKTLLYRTGLYSVARHVYRRLNPAARKERATLRRFHSELLQAGDLCFDIGANVGQTTESLLDCGTRVIAIEPNPLCLPVLEWQFGRNRSMTLVKKALGEKSGKAVLNFNGTGSMASLREDWPYSNPTSTTVEVTTLDELISRYGCPKFCKVDVEGFEPQVFKGLSQPIPIIEFEIHRNEVHRAYEILSRLSALGKITAANLTDMDHTGWFFDNWLSIEEFSRRFEERLPAIANAVLKMETDTPR